MHVPVSLVVGLGNPGAEYALSRHNIGFMVIAAFLADMKQAIEPEHTAESYLWTCRYAGRPLRLQTPLTYMNLSGQAVARVARRQQIPAREILVVYDELDLPLGRLRLREGGGSAGHNGIKSLIEDLQTDSFRRLRIGIDGPHRRPGIDYVLGPFAPDEIALRDTVIAAATATIQTAIRRGFTAAMNQYNRTDLRPQPPTDGGDATTDQQEPEESSS